MGVWLRTGGVSVRSTLSGRHGTFTARSFHSLVRSLVLLALASVCSLCTSSSALLVASETQTHHGGDSQSTSTSHSPQPRPSPGARRKRRNDPPPPVPSPTTLSKQLERAGLLTWADTHDGEDAPLQQRTLFQVEPSALSSADESTGAEGFETRALRMAFYNRLDPTRSDSEQDYVMNILMQATASVLARSIRVRHPSGLLDIAGDLDYYGEEIPGDPEGIDADIVMKVHSLPEDHEECEGTEALAWHERIEPGTGRPIFGTIQFCRVSVTDQEADLSTAVHEIIHALGFNPVLFSSYLGYPNDEDDVVEVGSSGALIKTPNVVSVVREHFDCDDMPGALLENFGGQGTAGGHWEERLFAGEMMDPMGGSQQSHHDRHVLTDLTVALLQDTGWYDVKYGAAGFNSYGYKAGCAFATGTSREALQSPGGERYLCDSTIVPAGAFQFACLHDRSGVGVCTGSVTSDDFNSTTPWFTSGRLDCMAPDRERGLRCTTPEDASDYDYSDHSQCVPMQCASTGGAPQVLVNGEPCDPQVMECPDDVYMCEDPGLLTCVGDLNDCSGVGDCYKGVCYCHGGWGGADCSVPACLASVGCDDGAACPASGFCGVPECGTWSSGASDRGVPCNGATGPAPTPPAPCDDASCDLATPEVDGLASGFSSAAGGPASSTSPVATAALAACTLLLILRNAL